MKKPKIKLTDKGLIELDKLMNKLESLGVPLRDSKRVHDYIRERKEFEKEIIVK